MKKRPITYLLLALFMLVGTVATFESCQKEDPVIEQVQVENLTQEIPVPEQGCIQGQTEFVCTYTMCYHYICINETWVPEGSHSLMVQGGTADGLHAPCPSFPHPWNQDGATNTSNDTPESSCTDPNDPNHSVTILWKKGNCSAWEWVNGVQTPISCFGANGAIALCNEWNEDISGIIGIQEVSYEDATPISTRAGGWTDLEGCSGVQYRIYVDAFGVTTTLYRWADSSPSGWGYSAYERTAREHCK